MTSSALGTGAGMSSSIAPQPPLSLTNISTNLSSAYGTSVPFGAQASGATSYSTASHNLSPLPIRANQISTMPPLCQVQRNIFFLFFTQNSQANRFFSFSCVGSHPFLISLESFSRMFYCPLIIVNVVITMCVLESPSLSSSRFEHLSSIHPITRML